MTALASTERLAERAAAIRLNALRIAAPRGQGYIGQALGCAEILSCLFFETMNLAGPPEHRDRFVLSPGHYALALYAVLAELGAYDFAELETYGMDGSRIEESPLEGIPGFEITGGSLSQGLSQAVGIALGNRLQERRGRVFCLISDGELQEGQTWEAVLAAGHRTLAELTIILDRNGLQVDGPTELVTTLEPVGEKFEAFGLDVVHVDGNDLGSVRRGLQQAVEHRERPTVLVCDTTLGRGVDAFEQADYPHYIREDEAVWAQAIEAVTKS